MREKGGGEVAAAWEGMDEWCGGGGAGDGEGRGVHRVREWYRQGRKGRVEGI